VIVGLTTRVTEESSYTETRDAVSWDWIQWCRSLDLIPVLLPNDKSVASNLFSNIALDLLILTGGNDFQEIPGTNRGGFCQQRNDTELSLIEMACERNVPVLGVCRGMHVINAYFGGTVVPSIADEGHESHVAVTHTLKILPSRFLDEGQVYEVNSFHNQGVKPDGLGKGLASFAFDRHGDLVEGLYHTSLPVVGIQWHPEREVTVSDATQAVLKNFLNLGE